LELPAGNVRYQGRGGLPVSIRNARFSSPALGQHGLCPACHPDEQAEIPGWIGKKKDGKRHPFFVRWLAGWQAAFADYSE